MATWDGSYSEPEDQNYYVYPHQNISAPSTDNWTYFPGNMNDNYLQTNREYYAQNEPVFEQNCPPAFYHIDEAPSNLLPVTNNYHGQVMTNNMDVPRVIPNTLEYFPTTSKSSQCFVPTRWNNYDRATATNSKDSFKTDASNVRSDIAGQSNLHATASEFVPNSNKAEDGKMRTKNVSLANDSRDSYIQDFATSSRAADNNFSYDRSKQERRYDNKRNTNYRHKESPHGQFPKGNLYKNSYKQQGRNYNKLPKEKYFNTRYCRSKSQEGITCTDATKVPVDLANESDACNGTDNTSAINIQEEECCSNISTDSRQNREYVNNANEEGSRGYRDDTFSSSKAKRHYNQAKEFSYQNSNSRQMQGHYRNARKYQLNKYDRDENTYRETKYNYQGYNGVRGNGNKDDKVDAKEKVHNYREHNGFRECYSKENKSEGKERRYTNQGYNELREYQNKKSKSEACKDTDRGRNAPVEGKDSGTENWRSKKESIDRSVVSRKGQAKKSLVDDDASQRERLTDQLNRGQLECLVCCEYIKQTNYIWSCTNCYHVLHLKCIKKWAKSSQGDNGWRCPACQNVSLTIPEDYFCFCGKARVPEWNRRDVAHSCGEICGRSLSKNNCIHKCTLLCHPGSCPPCISMVTKNCGCGKMSQTLQCSAHTLLLCDSLCGKDLNCGRHKCERKCHHGECGNCENTVEQECYCGKSKREITCQAGVSFTYSCGNICDKSLNCNNHTCKKLCHPDACEPCSLTPDKIKTCCCGQTVLTEKRENCFDPIPTCDKVCSKSLKCGQPNNPHKCKAICHQEECPSCDLTTDVKCRCGNMDREIACKDLTSKADDARCEKRCTKKRSCGKHKCNQLCCIDIEHICPLLCSKTLSCGRHKCEQSCHKGRCQPCWRSSFDELYCECGAAVIYPPVPCGTRRPTCDRPCSRQPSCGHEVLHNCHSEPTCPPCTILTQRWCHGKHELRKAVPCYVSEISCGLPCNKPLLCGRHKCVTICHAGACEKAGQHCSQPCTTPREMCGHICAAPCHESKCPDTPCKEMVKVTCQCGHRTTTRVCAENAKEYQRIASSILASKMADMQLGHSTNLEEIFGQGAKKQNQLKTLECNDECKIIERNRRLALGLQIVNPDLSAKLTPRYSDYMKQWAKKDPHFCQMVHDRLTELVQLAKTSKQKSRSYSFVSMNKDKRHFVHESCEHFGCESQAYDQEPKRNVVATAVREKCWLPSYSLLEIVQRENGQRKVPGPMLSTSKADGSIKTVLSLPIRKSQKPATLSSSKAPEPEIDYFDYQG